MEFSEDEVLIFVKMLVNSLEFFKAKTGEFDNKRLIEKR
jgi:hypothetical protein